MYSTYEKSFLKRLSLLPRHSFQRNDVILRQIHSIGTNKNLHFTAEELAIIQDTSVDNSVRSTYPDASTSIGASSNQYASDTPTTDKIFLLSVQEATKSEYGFDVSYNFAVADNKRIRQTTDYDKASGGRQVMEEGMGGVWWLRSPMSSQAWFAQCVGGAGGSAANYVEQRDCGIVPALCVSD